MKVRFRSNAIIPVFIMIVLLFIFLPFVLTGSENGKYYFVGCEIVLGIIALALLTLDYFYLWKELFFGLSFSNKGYREIISEINEEQVVGCKKIIYSYGNDGEIQTFTIGKRWIMVEGCNNNSANMTINGLGPFTERIKDTRRSYSATHMFFCIDDISQVNIVKRGYLATRRYKPELSSDKKYYFYEVCYKNNQKEYIRLGLSDKVDFKRVEEVCSFLNKGINHSLENLDISDAFDSDDYIELNIENEGTAINSNKTSILNGLERQYCPICEKIVTFSKGQNRCVNCGHSFKFEHKPKENTKEEASHNVGYIVFASFITIAFIVIIVFIAVNI